MAGRQRGVVHLTRTHGDPDGGPPPPVAATLVGSAPKPNKRQREAATVLTPDARCTPVLVRAVIVGKARMPKAVLELTSPTGEVIGNVALANTSAAFDPQQRFWLVGEPVPGALVALVSEGRRQVILPGSRLRAGGAEEPAWSALACRMLGWQRPLVGSDAPEGWQDVLGAERATVANPAFLAAVDRFRNAAVLLPLLFFLVCFPYLFVIRPLVEAGVSAPVLLALPVLGGGFMTVWSVICRRELVAEAEQIEAGASRYGKEIALSQSYWSGMRKRPVAWDGPLPTAAR